MGMYIFMLIVGIIISVGASVFAKREKLLVGEIVLYTIAVLGIVIISISFALIFKQATGTI